MFLLKIMGSGNQDAYILSIQQQLSRELESSVNLCSALSEVVENPDSFQTQTEIDDLYIKYGLTGDQVILDSDSEAFIKLNDLVTTLATDDPDQTVLAYIDGGTTALTVEEVLSSINATYGAAVTVSTAFDALAMDSSSNLSTSNSVATTYLSLLSQKIDVINCGGTDFSKYFVEILSSDGTNLEKATQILQISGISTYADEDTELSPYDLVCGFKDVTGISPIYSLLQNIQLTLTTFDYSNIVAVLWSSFKQLMSYAVVGAVAVVNGVSSFFEGLKNTFITPDAIEEVDSYSYQGFNDYGITFRVPSTISRVDLDADYLSFLQQNLVSDKYKVIALPSLRLFLWKDDTSNVFIHVRRTVSGIFNDFTSSVSMSTASTFDEYLELLGELISSMNIPDGYTSDEIIENVSGRDWISLTVLGVIYYYTQYKHGVLTEAAALAKVKAINGLQYNSGAYFNSYSSQLRGPNVSEDGHYSNLNFVNMITGCSFTNYLPSTDSDPNPYTDVPDLATVYDIENCTTAQMAYFSFSLLINGVAALLMDLESDSIVAGYNSNVYDSTILPKGRFDVVTDSENYTAMMTVLKYVGLTIASLAILAIGTFAYVGIRRALTRASAGFSAMSYSVGNKITNGTVTAADFSALYKSSRKVSLLSALTVGVAGTSSTSSSVISNTYDSKRILNLIKNTD